MTPEEVNEYGSYDIAVYNGLWHVFREDVTGWLQDEEVMTVLCDGSIHDNFNDITTDISVIELLHTKDVCQECVKRALMKLSDGSEYHEGQKLFYYDETGTYSGNYDVLYYHGGLPIAEIDYEDCIPLIHMASSEYNAIMRYVTNKRQIAMKAIEDIALSFNKDVLVEVAHMLPSKVYRDNMLSVNYVSTRLERGE